MVITFQFVIVRIILLLSDAMKIVNKDNLSVARIGRSKQKDHNRLPSSASLNAGRLKDLNKWKGLNRSNARLNAGRWRDHNRWKGRDSRIGRWSVGKWSDLNKWKDHNRLLSNASLSAGRQKDLNKWKGLSKWKEGSLLHNSNHRFNNARSTAAMAVVVHSKVVAMEMGVDVAKGIN